MLRTKPSPLLARALRLALFLVCCQVVFTLMLARHVNAQVKNLMLTVGSQLMQLGEPGAARPPRTLMLNGTELRLRVQTARNRKLGEVLDTFERRCRERSGRFHELLTERSVELTQPQRELLDGVIRADAGRAGMVACLDVGEARLGVGELLERVHRFLRSGDVSDIGYVRYVRAEQDGADVFLVMFWNDGPFNIRRMFPTSGDAPGVDIPGLPRPPKSRRVLSAWEEGEGPALNLYEVEGMSADASDRHYRATLAEQGWHALNPESSGTRKTRGLMVMRGGLTAVLASSDTERGSLISVLPMDDKGGASVRRN